MNKKAINLYRGNIEGYPENTQTETDKLIQSIIERTTQTASNKSNEIDIMQSMLNDKDFKVAIFESGKGYIGSRSPRDEAIGIAVDTLSGATGMSKAEARALTENYEFTRKDAGRFINIGKDFISTYLQTGRKTTLISDPRGEVVVNLKHIEEHDKSVPDKNNPGKTKIVKTTESIKLVSSVKK